MCYVRFMDRIDIMGELLIVKPIFELRIVWYFILSIFQFLSQ